MTEISSAATAVHDLYTTRLNSAEAAFERETRQDHKIGNFRLAVFAGELVVAWFSLARHEWSSWWLLAPAIVFVLLLIIHERTAEQRYRAERRVEFYRRGLSRIEGTWRGEGGDGERYRPLAPLFAADLDVFGRASLFQLLCTARTRAGEDQLATWLTGSPPIDELRERQQAVAALTPDLDLREELALLAGDVKQTSGTSGLAKWGAAPPLSIPVPLAASISMLLALGAVVGVAVWVFAKLPLIFYGVLVLDLIYMVWSRPWSRPLSTSMNINEKEIAIVQALIGRIERQKTGQSTLLSQIRETLAPGGEPVSRRLGAVKQLIALNQAGRNMAFAPVAGLIHWGVFTGIALERWRTLNGPLVGDWIKQAGQYEALCALAGFSFEHPDYVFPELNETEAVFQAADLAHPLLGANAIANDLTLDSSTRLLIVSGSNMSGKSTLLRSVGTNAILAHAGAPVRAKSLSLGRVSCAASIRTFDSLDEGISRFYAEIARMRDIVDLARQQPVLFLMDEILSGTNSSDRAIGAAALLRGLLRYGAIGLITTHDLALTAIAEDPAVRAKNVHLEDTLEDGKMAFDYHLRTGVVQKSNALALMRAVGLEVDA